MAHKNLALRSFVTKALTLAIVLAASGCTTTTTSAKPDKKPEGFFGQMMDQLTERDCQVSRFSCPYGLGPAGERCECTDPSGRVWAGWTVK